MLHHPLPLLPPKIREYPGIPLRDSHIPLEQILAVGGSGSDEDMMRGNTLAVVVANRHHEELSQLVDQDKIFFASQPYALGILEAIEHYDFFNARVSPAPA